MASGNTGRKRIADAGEQGIVTRISESSVVQIGKSAASSAAFVGKKLAISTGKAAWIAGTTLLILAVPLLIEYERDAQLAELEMHQASLLGTPSK